MSGFLSAVSGVQDKDETVQSLPQEQKLASNSSQQLATDANGYTVADGSSTTPRDLTTRLGQSRSNSPARSRQLNASYSPSTSIRAPQDPRLAAEARGNEAATGLSAFGTRQVGIIGRDKPREIVRIERDYSAGEVVQFFSGWMWEFEGRITPRAYDSIMKEINQGLASAHDPSKSLWDNIFAVLTLYISPKLFGSHFEREMRRFQKVLEKANEEILNPAGLNVLSPRRNGFLYLDFEYY
ncbi:hypothetical protein OIO90_001111 [Microbotryomycetes sp. JL221]|nr:hypothetical protein OIO90_001111 [Microbotryomycetes sp. JL221]